MTERGVADFDSFTDFDGLESSTNNQCRTAAPFHASFLQFTWFSASCDVPKFHYEQPIIGSAVERTVTYRWHPLVWIVFFPSTDPSSSVFP